ncbi:hypothetical protein BaRGS_00012339 [Batillaria attramentaria]|uniref:Uncharacterized protein n=1 Tax=Batillaria attramentaria TaxID=370345 RepID=A0ABD0LAK2_9CAEN
MWFANNTSIGQLRWDKQLRIAQPCIYIALRCSMFYAGDYSGISGVDRRGSRRDRRDDDYPNISQTKKYCTLATDLTQHCTPPWRFCYGTIVQFYKKRT